MPVVVGAALGAEHDVRTGRAWDIMGHHGTAGAATLPLELQGVVHDLCARE